MNLGNDYCDLSSEILNHIESNFINNIIELIINYPIIWYNFLENILKNKLMISFKNRAIIISLELLTWQLKNTFECIYSVMLSSHVVLRTIERKGFLIIYVYSEVISDFFRNSGFWLEYITNYACLDIGFKSSRGVVLKAKDKTIQEVDVVVDLNKSLILIECKDTYNYKEYDLKKLSNLRKKLSISSSALFVCSKMAYDLDYDKFDLGFVRYKYNYEEFRDDLKEEITNRLISF